ncbi:helix-turn-helix transcriptional regulator [Mycobacterium sp.]|uniref:helix-turn-helix domain-containing protein n=1 Tax=Mycobacterium sp. TaxID=1785 RepID=UPI002BA3553F|nr:helix-turn-helix transcriptional regulator [Mycobacterium sp.]HKP44088.1 helix-turn-helix transcriptional regulator [Mycobacterium sp.]
MSTSTEGLPIPEWDLADRLGKSLRVAGVSVQVMADYLDVHRNTVSAWINGRTPPSTQTIRLWSLRTGVPYEWLRDGVEPDRPDGPDDGVARPERLELPTF